MANNQLTDVGTLYSPLVGLVFVFNLIVGTGALTMPKAFAAAGWLLSLIMVIALAFTSYMTVTFVTEVMASANAVRRWQRIKLLTRESNGHGSDNLVEELAENVDETSPLMSSVNRVGHTHRDHIVEDRTIESKIHYFEITERIEMGQMASMFFNKIGLYLFYAIIIIYLYGDLAIYVAAVPKSLRDVACTYQIKNNSHHHNLTDDDICWASAPSISRMNAYRIFVALFVLLLGPFTFFNVQKTTLLQVFTSILRWLAFAIMIVLAVIRLAQGKGEGHPQAANISGIPTLFGVCVYSFMCHHSLPSLTTPIRDKSKMYSLFAIDYALILVFYCIISFTAIYAFSDLQDLYTLNFAPNSGSTENPITNVDFIKYFLSLFPVFTLSTNFPIITITLRNNLTTLFLKDGKVYSFFVSRCLFPILTIIPPVLVALITNHVDFLVSITGSYAGAGIQYFIPAALVLCSRKQVTELLGTSVHNKHVSPFRHKIWVILIILWASIAIVLVTVNHIVSG